MVVQGSGKSHTTSVIAENCLLHRPSHPIIRLQARMPSPNICKLEIAQADIQTFAICLNL